MAASVSTREPTLSTAQRILTAARDALLEITVDLNSGYVRVFQEMMAAGWNSTEVRDAVRELIGGWTRVLTEAAQQGPRLAPTSGRFRRRK